MDSESKWLIKISPFIISEILDSDEKLGTVQGVLSHMPAWDWSLTTHPTSKIKEKGRFYSDLKYNHFEFFTFEMCRWVLECGEYLIYSRHMNSKLIYDIELTLKILNQ